MSTLFFFQAEDGIRDLVRSRGLGDVYKRQVLKHALTLAEPEGYVRSFVDEGPVMARLLVNATAVSYTHLTLPTSDLV